MNKSKHLFIRFSSLIVILLLITFFSLGSKGDQTVGAQAQIDNPVGFLTGESQGEPSAIAMNYIHGNVASLGLVSTDLAGYKVLDKYVSEHNQTTHIYLQQNYNGIKVHNAIININISANGEVINVGNRFVGQLANKVNATTPKITASDAIGFTAQDLGLNMAKQAVEMQSAAADDVAQSALFSGAGISQNPIPVSLVYQPMEDGSVRLAWETEVYELSDENWWSTRVDALTGEILDQHNNVIHDNFGVPEHAGETAVLEEKAAAPELSVPFQTTDGSSYNVFPLPVESPNHGTRSIVSQPANSVASPYGWHDTNGSAGPEFTTTRGNNVNAYEDGNNSGFQPNAGSGLDFDYPINFSQHPDNYESAAITNLFYWNNIIHDVMYQYGFNEASGNFQENNYGKGGSGSDSVNAEAQDGSGTNNANFSTPTDGGNPRMQMYLWTAPNPDRDGDLDNGIIIHEYGHGISTRLTGGPSTSSCLNNTEQAGEGWSDFFSVIMTIESGDSGTDKRGVGTYALNQPATGDGIRDYPYSTSMSIDPRTYNEIKTAAVPHGVGSTWTAMVWEMTWALIDVHGFDPDIYNGTGGNNVALQLVIDGLKLQPCSPGFVDARDAILLADQNNNGGANQCIIWQAFAKRGLGVSASQGSSGSRSDGTQAFDIPSACTGPTPTPTNTSIPPTITPTSSPTNTPVPGSCTTYNSTNVPISLPNGTSSISSNLNIGGSGTINDVNVSVDMPHAWPGDLSFTLTHQDSGTAVTIIDRPGVPASTWGCSTDNIDVTLDDEAGTAVESQCAGSPPAISGTHSPNNPLSAFDGESGNGTWVLTVNDAYTSGDAGTLNGWSVEICTVGVVPTPTSTSIPPTATSTSVPPTNTPTSTPPPSGDVFFDDFETNQGWTVNPNGTDSASTGLWERANPDQTTYSGTTYQLGTTTSGSFDLVTAGAAGSGVGSNDIDGGTTSVRSPNIALPSSGNLTLSFDYYLSHYSNSDSSDFFRVTVVGNTSSVVLQELGAADIDGAAWATHTSSLNSFAGQTVYILIEASDSGGGSLVEAGVDDVRITSN